MGNGRCADCDYLGLLTVMIFISAQVLMLPVLLRLVVQVALTAN